MRFLKSLTAWAWVAAGGALWADGASSTPFVPTDDAVVLERLPTKPGDPVQRELSALRTSLAGNPRDPELAASLARRYFDLAMAEGDPRYVGYAEAALRPWAGSDAPAPVLVARGLLRQYRHDFDSALTDLARALELNPDETDALAWRAAIFMVRADYAAAQRACNALVGRSSELLATGCAAYVKATTGATQAAYTELSAALARAPHAAPSLRQWALTRLAEMAIRMGDAGRAEQHFREALALDVTDNFLLAAFADFLLAQNRPREVAVLLKDWVRSDTLLLRLALAEKALGTLRAAQHEANLAARFADAAQRGERLHMAEEARFLLQIRGDARGALSAASENWKAQREPRDAAMLLEAGLAAKDSRAAQPALEWLASSGFEDAQLARLAAGLRALAR